jgi:hypothetical protein
LRTLGGMHGIVDGLRNVDAAPSDSLAHSEKPGVGRKRSATSDAPGSDSRAKGPLAASSDFPSDHWVEPLSENGERSLLRSPHSTARTHSPTRDPRRTRAAPASSPMKVDSPPAKGKSKVVDSPLSSPISQNPLLAKKYAPTPLALGFIMFKALTFTG